MQTAEFRVPGGVFVIRFWPTFLTILMLVVLIGLGFWQLQRLHWKENLLAEITARLKEPVVSLTLIERDDNIAALEYRRVRADGIFLNDKEIYLSAISLTGEGGYHILTPLQTVDGNYLLVDRGWVPYTRKQPASRKESQIKGFTEVAGVLRLSGTEKPWMRPDNIPSRNSWYWLDLPAMVRAAGMPSALPFVLEADATPNPGGYPVGGQTRVDLPNNHLNYAITWFGLAGVLLVIYGVSGYRKVSSKA